MLWFCHFSQHLLQQLGECKTTLTGIFRALVALICVDLYQIRQIEFFLRCLSGDVNEDAVGVAFLDLDGLFDGLSLPAAFFAAIRSSRMFLRMLRRLFGLPRPGLADPPRGLRGLLRPGLRPGLLLIRGLRGLPPRLGLLPGLPVGLLSLGTYKSTQSSSTSEGQSEGAPLLATSVSCSSSISSLDSKKEGSAGREVR